MTCVLNANAVGDYEVCVLPHWKISASKIESFENVADAFERHAQIAITLRSAGWRVDHETSRSAAAA